MARVFTLESLLGVPAPGLRAVLLTARADLDLANEAAALDEIRQVATGADAALLDLSHAFAGVAAIRCLRALAAPGRPVAVVGAPRWLVDLGPRLDLPALPHSRTVAEAVDRWRLDSAPPNDGHPLTDGCPLHDGHADGHPYCDGPYPARWLRPPAPRS